MAFSDTVEASEESALYGTPDEICRKLERLRSAGIEYVLLNGGGMSRQNLQRFAPRGHAASQRWRRPGHAIGGANHPDRGG